MKNRGWIIVGAAASLSLGVAAIAQAGSIDRQVPPGASLKPVTVHGAFVLADALAAPGRSTTPWATGAGLRAPQSAPVAVSPAEAAPAPAAIAPATPHVDTEPGPVSAAPPTTSPGPHPSGEPDPQQGTPRGDKDARGHQGQDAHDHGTRPHGASADRGRNQGHAQMVEPEPAQSATRVSGGGEREGARKGGEGHSGNGHDGKGRGGSGHDGGKRGGR